MIGNRNELGIKRLLHVFQVLDRILQHDLVVESILEGVGIILLGKVGGIKEVMVAPLFVGCITIPEAPGIPVEDSTGLVAILRKNERRCLLGIGTTVVHHKGTLVQTEQACFNHRLCIRCFTSFYLVKDIGKSKGFI